MIPTPTLLLIDIQPEHFTKSVKKEFPHFIKNITTLLAFARKNKFRIIHVREKYDMTKPNTLLKKNTFTKWQTIYRQMNTQCTINISGNPLPCVRALSHEPVMFKPAFDAFVGTKLHTLLQTSKNKTNNQVIWLAGLMTSICIHHTANGALTRGYKVKVVVDCCADRKRAQHDMTIALYNNCIWQAIRISQFSHNTPFENNRENVNKETAKQKTKTKKKSIKV